MGLTSEGLSGSPGYKERLAKERQKERGSKEGEEMVGGAEGGGRIGEASADFF